MNNSFYIISFSINEAFDDHQIAAGDCMIDLHRYVRPIVKSKTRALFVRQYDTT